MTVESIGNRLAGKVLGDYFSQVGKSIIGQAGKLGSAAGEYVAGIPILSKLGAGTAEEVSGIVSRAPVIGKLLATPKGVSAVQSVASNLPAAAEFLTTGGSLLGGAKVLSSLIGNVSPDSDRSYRPPAFASSAYSPGTLPFTNEQMGESILNQQRFRQQLQLLQARQLAGAPQSPAAINANLQSRISAGLQQTYQY